jgi:serine/alanine racemase
MDDEIINSAYETWTSLFGLSRNGLFMGTIFVMIGMFFAQGYIKIKPLVSLCGFVVSLLCLFFEVRLLSNYDIARDYNMSVFLVLTVLFLFSFASSLRLKDRPIYVRLRTVGVLIYFLHLLVSEFVILGIDVIHEFLRVDLMPLTCLITLVVTVCISVVLEKLSHKEKCSWIKWFLS